MDILQICHTLVQLVRFLHEQTFSQVLEVLSVRQIEQTMAHEIHRLAGEMMLKMNEPRVVEWMMKSEMEWWNFVGE